MKKFKLSLIALALFTFCACNSNKESTDDELLEEDTITEFDESDTAGIGEEALEEEDTAQIDIAALEKEEEESSKENTKK